jgi:endoglucanase
MPSFIVWLFLSMPPTLNPEDLINLPANQEKIKFSERYGFVFYGFVYCIFLGFLAQSLAFFPGLVHSVDKPLSSQKMFTSTGASLTDALKQLSALTVLSVAASEPKSLVLRNWVGKLTMASRLKRGNRALDDGSFQVAPEIDDFGAEGMPLLVDVFADEKHSEITRGLWEAWAAFAATSPDPTFLARWASCQENLSMSEAVNTANPFDAHLLYVRCGLPLKQLAVVLDQDVNDLKRELIPENGEADAEANIAGDLELFNLTGLSHNCLQAFATLRKEYVQPKYQHDRHQRSNDMIMKSAFPFHGQALSMFYIARGKPDESETPVLKTRAILEHHWVCLSEAYFTTLRSERAEAKQQFWSWATEALGDSSRSDWETLRRCFARVRKVSGDVVELCDLSADMHRYFSECPRLPDEAARKSFVLPVRCLDAYIPARGKAGALNFAVRLLLSRKVLTSESLFAIFDARHMPVKKFWYWTLPTFFSETSSGAFELNKRVSFVQAPQTFTKMPGINDYLDLQNGFFYNVMNQMRNKAGAVTSCGTNAVWLLPGQETLPFTGQKEDAVLWQFPYFEEMTKIEDTATSHRLITEDKYSLYVNPGAENKDEAASIGVAKEGPDYLAALERWCEGAVQLFWVTLVRGPGRGPCIAIFAYCCSWLGLLFYLVRGQPLVFCSQASPLTAGLCQPFADFYNSWQFNYKRDYDQNEAWKLMAGRVAVQLLESWIWIFLYIAVSAIGLACLAKWERLARYVVMYDNMTNYISSTTCFYWVFVNVYLVTGSRSPFHFDIGWLCVWFSLMTACRWMLLYSAKSQGNCEGLSLWRSQALWLLNAPGQIMAMLQGTKAAYDILVRSVDKSWWIDPKELVKAIARVWSLLVFLLSPVSVLIVCRSWYRGELLQQQVASMALLFYTACQIAQPMAFIWNLERALQLRSCGRRQKAPSTKRATCVTTTLRALIEVMLPIGVAVALLWTVPTPPSMLNLTPLARHGWLHIDGTQIIDEYNQPVQLRGVSLFWSQWEPEYWNVKIVQWLRDDWNISLIRAAMGVEKKVDGYLKHPSLEKNKVERIVQAAIANGVYVIIDWHVEQIRNGTDVDPNATTGGRDKVHNEDAKRFFREMSEKYGDHPNILYELWDEPTTESWSHEIKPYYEETVAVIRAGEKSARRRRNPTIAPKTQGLIILGTRHYSADVDDASMDMPSGENLALALHFYQIATVKDREWFRVRTWNALSRGAPIFVSEWGSSACDQGSNDIDANESLLWLSFLDSHNISNANWAVSNKDESCSLLKPGASATGGWPLDQVTQAGQFIRSYMRGELTPPDGAGCAGHICPPCAEFNMTVCMQGADTTQCGYCNFCCQQHMPVQSSAMDFVQFVI